jgi:hypothetical protein
MNKRLEKNKHEPEAQGRDPILSQQITSVYDQDYIVAADGQ